MPTLAEILGMGPAGVQASANPNLQQILAAAQRGRKMPPARDFDAKFDTVLNPAEEAQFQAWKSQYAPKDSGADYDLRGAFKAGLKPGPDGHWLDTFKKPNHPTFSNESRYAPFGNPGRWDGDTFIPANVTPPPMIGVRG